MEAKMTTSFGEGQAGQNPADTTADPVATANFDHAAEIGPTPPTVDFDEIIGQLEDAYDYLPEDALRACQAHRDLAVPHLIDVFERVTRTADEGEEVEDNAAIFALFLLAEFQAVEAIPAVWRFLKLPNNLPDHLLGDAITEDLPRILAIFAGARLDLLEELAADSRLNICVRWAGINALTYLVRDGLVTREEAIARLKRYLHTAMERRDTDIIDQVISKLCAFNAFEARPEIEQAFAKGLVDEMFIDLATVNEELCPATPDRWRNKPFRTPTQITDTLKEMRGWQWRSDADGSDADVPELADEAFGLFDNDIPRPIRLDTPRVGRNDPCPCLSGKKFKKCCLRS